MPPVRITKVIPIATMPTTTDWSSRFRRLLPVRKYGDSSDSATAITTASPSMRVSRRVRLRLRSVAAAI